MRYGFPEILHLVAAVDGMAIHHKKDRMRHRSVVPLLAVPNLIDGRGSVGPRRRRISWPTGRHPPVVFLGPVDEHRHLLCGLVDGDQDTGALRTWCGFGLNLGLPDGRIPTHVGSFVPTHARPVAVCPR